MAFDLIITSFRMNNRESASQVLERLFGFEPEHARALVRQFPATVIEGTTRAHAEIAAEQLREAGAKVEVSERKKVSAALVSDQAKAFAEAASKGAESKASAAEAIGTTQPAQQTSKALDATIMESRAEPAKAAAEPVAPAVQGAGSANKVAAQTEAFGGDVMEKLAAAAQKLQAKHASMQQAVAPSAGAAQVRAPASAAADAAAPRKMFSTVAMKNIEADLQKFEVTDFGPPPAVAHNSWADSMPPDAPSAPSAAGGQKHEPSAPSSSLKMKGGKPDLTDIEDLFAPPQAKAAPHAVAPQAAKPKGDALDELFSPPGADDYFKQKPELSAPGRGVPRKDVQARPLSPRGEKAFSPPADKSLDQGSLDGGSGDGAKTAGKATLKAVLTKVAAGVAALGVVAGTGLAVLNARDARALNKPSAGQTAEGKAQAVLAAKKKGIHPVVRLAPSSLAPAFAGILRQQVDKVHHVRVEWDGAPDDVDCMLVAHDKKSEARMAKLMRTGERIEYPPEAEEQFKEHVETLRTAMGKPGKKFEPVCLSVAFLDDSDKSKPELTKLAVEVKDDDEDEDEDKGEATIGAGGSNKHDTSF